MHAALNLSSPCRNRSVADLMTTSGRGWSWWRFWRSGETIERWKEERSAFRTDLNAGSGFPFFRSPVLLPRRRRVTQWVTSYTTNLPSCAAVTRTEEWCEALAERVSFSGSRIRCVARLHILGVVNR
ncbi:unnamed protein product [Brassica rapa]|uniref:Uncharacterized protein n=1 Tax=Brassica campestris TaxID=3711 RepID=A0A3P6C6G9_BRACM|nr:unnamed protein product [Brassica rapa]VDD04082.1 unnamed protein product [Brassica rapa]